MERSVFGFEVERREGSEWVRAASQASHLIETGSSYQTVDRMAPQGEVRYRLLEQDLDGSRQELGQVLIGAAASVPEAELKLFPNPAFDRVKLSTNGFPIVALRVFDALGRTVMQTNGASELDIHTLDQGSYQIEALVGDQTIHARFSIVR